MEGTASNQGLGRSPTGGFLGLQPGFSKDGEQGWGGGATSRSWAAIVEGREKGLEESVPPCEIREVEGERQLFVLKVAYKAMVKIFDFAAIGALAGNNGSRRLDYPFIFNTLKKQWADYPSVRFTVVGKGNFIIRTASEEEINAILTPGAWRVGSRVLVANRWRPGQPMKVEATNRVRIWIRLPDFPMEMWRDEVFEDVAAILGARFISTDQCTRWVERNGFARIQIKVPIGYQPLPEFKMRMEDENVIAQVIEYEAKVKFCTSYGSTTHFTANCNVSTSPTNREASKASKDGWSKVRTVKFNMRKQEARATQDTRVNRFEALGGEDLLPPLAGNEQEGGAIPLHAPVFSIAIDSIKQISAIKQIPSDQGASEKQGNTNTASMQMDQPSETSCRNHDSPVEIDDTVQGPPGFAEKGHMEVDTENVINGDSDVPVSMSMEEVVNVGSAVSLTRTEDRADLEMDLVVHEDSDFNSILSATEKSGRAPTAVACSAFLNFIASSNLVERSDEHFKFSWSINRCGDRNVMCLLDRVFFNHSWLDNFRQLSTVSLLPRSSSDHNPVVVRLKKINESRPGKSVFRFFNFWQDKADCLDIIHSVWNQKFTGCPMIQCRSKLQELQARLSRWARETKENLTSQIDSIRQDIANLQIQAERGSLHAVVEEKSLKARLTKLLQMEEDFWRQKSRMKWLKSGDANTRFFHEAVKMRRRRNKIHQIVIGDITVTDPKEVMQAVSDHFYQFLGQDTSSGSVPCAYSDGPKVTEDDNIGLLNFITDDEIKEAVMGADGDSASGPDGFCNARFFGQVGLGTCPFPHSSELEALEVLTAVHRARPVDLEFVARGVLKSFVSAPQVLADPGQQVEQMASLTSHWGEKSQVVGFNVNRLEIQQVATELGWAVGSLPLKYLGLPLHMEKLSTNHCHVLLIKMESKLTAWKQKLLSYSGRLCLVNSVLASISNYWSMVFQLPSNTLKQMECLCSKFLWGDDVQKRHFHLISWSKACLPKAEGGLGIRCNRKVNDAALAFLAVRALSTDSAWGTYVRDKENVRWQVKSGTAVKFWKDQWLDCPLNRSHHFLEVNMQVDQPNVTVFQMVTSTYIQTEALIQRMYPGTFLPPSESLAGDVVDVIVWKGQGIWTKGWSQQRESGAIVQIVSWERNHTLGLAAMVKLSNDTIPCAVVKWSRLSASMGETWLLNFCLKVVTQEYKPIVLQANNKRWLQWINRAVRRQPRLIAHYSKIEQYLAYLQIDNTYPASSTIALFFLAKDGNQFHEWKDLPADWDVVPYANV
ncbi:putative ribonuclease H protein [Nymphaea thermarum]|nr:putative ribonuclease H protein [Nymphaea thermarum]